MKWNDTIATLFFSTVCIMLHEFILSHPTNRKVLSLCSEAHDGRNCNLDIKSSAEVPSMQESERDQSTTIIQV
jgi:hypothetical protein